MRFLAGMRICCMVAEKGSDYFGYESGTTEDFR